MKNKHNTSTATVKPILVRLKSHEHREAFEQYCKDNARNLGPQASVLIVNELIACGYIQKESVRTVTQ